ncbi:LysR family transcriptional regulator [Nitrospirillum iridis]|uniref:DNA-binding transcriptional LysR family regulator n=1 Tax=Nitrospirillum iridis TaxID=765888 RepID=A0A7X0EFC2_9PROT|nr:LysR family transcriptional regulator [Nitrospirillum iridis]MBB6252344.1 DNA-binding transcriptional LysR family regulator [Nitrospirillum iridis]
MDRFDAMRVFTRIVERRSFTAAAEDLGMPRATVTHTLQQLEGRLGTRLLNRTTRHVSPTLDGEAYYQRCLRLLADVEEAEGAFRATEPKGLLRVDVHGKLARHFLFPALPAFLARYPGLELNISEGDRLVDLVREGVDCVLRAGEPRDSALIARRVAVLPQVTVASPAYLDRHGVPTTLDDLDGHQAVNFVSSVTGRPFPFEFLVGDEVRHITLPGVVSVSGADSFADAARLGLGLIQTPGYHLGPDLAAGTLVPVLPLYPPPPIPVSVLYPQNRQLSPRVRVFVDWVASLFKGQS